jgi:ubiquinone/menaquinone biosynthesis C-methylase UbiE
MTGDPSDEVRGPGLRIARHYASEAQAYRDLWAPVLVRLARWLTDERVLRDARRILDLGCGVGALLPLLRDGSPQAMVVGLDRTQAMVALGPRAFPLLVGDAVALPFRDRSFDAVVTTFMLFHLPDPTAGLAEARRVLRPDGWIGLLTWGSQRDSRARTRWVEELRAEGAAEFDEKLAWHELVDTPRKLQGRLRAAGFSHVNSRVERFVERPSPAEFIARRTNLGSCRYRWEALPEQGRRALLARAGQWLTTMSAEDFEEESEVIVTVARRGEETR